jgi:hypothetical protein
MKYHQGIVALHKSIKETLEDDVKALVMKALKDQY